MFVIVTVLLIIKHFKTYFWYCYKRRPCLSSSSCDFQWTLKVDLSQVPSVNYLVQQQYVNSNFHVSLEMFTFKVHTLANGTTTS